MSEMTSMIESIEQMIEIKGPIVIPSEKGKIFDVWDLDIDDPNPQMFSD